MMNIDSLPLSKLYVALQSGELGDEWEKLEVETILLHLEIDPTVLARDKVHVCKIAKIAPEMFYEDLVFFSHAVTVMNNEAADFNTFPALTSLEIAYALVDMAVVLHVVLDMVPEYSLGVKMLIKKALVDDGYSKVIYPFDHVGITGLEGGQTAKDMSNKEKAISAYIKGMYECK